MLRGKTLVLGIGAQRCGTTWLHDYLSGSPQVFGSPIKEMHFFDTHLRPQSKGGWLPRMRRQYERLSRRPSTPERKAHISALRDRLSMHEDPPSYLRYFADRVGDRSFMCEITPSYALLDADQFRWARELIATANVDLKIVYLMRDPVDRHRSYVQDRLKRGGQVVDFVSSLTVPEAVARTRYDITLENVRAVFRPDQIITAFYEHIFRDPDTHLKAVADSIGIDYIKPNVEDRINATVRRETPLDERKVKAAVTAFAPVYDYINREFADKKPASWRA